MPLNLNDLLKKAEKKGISSQPTSHSDMQFLRPWQQESVLYSPPQSEIKLSQTEAKVEPKLSQANDKVEPKLSQTGAKVEPIFHELPKNPKKVEPKVEPKLSQYGAKVEPNQSQTEAKLEPKTSFSSLVGLQKKIVLLIHQICQTILEQQTSPLSIELIAEQCQSTKPAIRKAIQRLEQKGIIFRASFKNGRGGWTQYQLPDQIYQEILMLKNNKFEPNLSQTWAKVEPKLGQTEAKLRTELEPQLEPKDSSSSSYIKTTTTELDNEWNFDISPYGYFGFTTSQLKQLALLKKISAADVEQSLIEFNFDLENNMLPKIKTNKINFLMGLLRNGNLYVSESYRGEQEQLVKLMAERALERSKAQLEEKFILWEQQLGDEEREEIMKKMPTYLVILYKSNGINQKEIKNWLLDYYTHNVPCRT